MAGYSGTPLAKKLGFKDGYRIRIKNAPADYLDLVSPRPENVQISKNIRKNIDIFHFLPDLPLNLRRTPETDAGNSAKWHDLDFVAKEIIRSFIKRYRGYDSDCRTSPWVGGCQSLRRR